MTAAPGLLLKELMPKEHGVWAWLVLPLVLALALVPQLSTFFAAIATLTGFLMVHGLGRLRRGKRAALRPTLAAGALAAIAGVVAVVTAAYPIVMVATLGAGGMVGVAAMATLGDRPPRVVAVELAAIVAFVGLGLGIALAGGGRAGTLVCAALALAAWLVAGLWWVKGQLAHVLAHREAWVGGWPIVAALVAASIAAGVFMGHPLVGLVPLVYGLRIVAHRPPSQARDVKRVGLTELAWGGGAVLLLALVARV